MATETPTLPATSGRTAENCIEIRSKLSKYYMYVVNI